MITNTQDTNSGANPSFESVQVTVTCAVTAIANPAAPTSGLTYTVGAAALSIDLSATAYT